MSDAAIPVTEQDQSLVQRLREKRPHEIFPWELMDEAADRIEELELELQNQRSRAWTVAGELADRVKALEAALREIGYGAIGHGDVWDIARRALEGKP